MIKKITVSLMALGLVLPAKALEFNYGNTELSLTGAGTAGLFESNKTDNPFVSNWFVRGQAAYNFSNNYKVGLVYALDELAIYENENSKDIFVFLQSNDWGRLEFGITQSAASKLSVGIPDVGGLAISNNPLYYRKMDNDTVLSSTTLDSGRYDLRFNYILPKFGDLMSGVSFAFSDNHNFALDGGLKYKDSAGKLKSVYSFGVSYIDSPTNLQTDAYSKPVFADSRSQVSAGANFQYNSFMFGSTLRLVYDSNASGIASDGLVFANGVSYDFLKLSASVSYVLSSSDIWQANGSTSDTVIGSLRYKFDKMWDVWLSGGYSDSSPFISGGIGIKF